MTLPPEIVSLTPEMTAWRHELHSHPELSGQERWTAGRVAEILRGLGLEPHTGIGGHGVVAVVEGAKPGPSVAFRADFDALPLNDESGAVYASKQAGVSHACGHDGHTSALLGLARHLVRRPPVRGRVVLIFQPAEETGEGARAMIRDGLLQRFAFDEIYAFHNMPLLPAGSAGVRAGSTLNGYIVWEVEIEGVGGHGAAFYKAIDPLQAAARLAVEISSIVGRYIDPAESALINVAKLQAGSSHNVIPARASLAGTARAISPEVLAKLYERLETICDGVAKMTGCAITCRRLAEAPPCVNDAQAADHVAQACAAILGADKVVRDFKPFPFTDDFALFLQAAPGAYMFLGQESAMCHNPAYDFDDRLLPVAVSIFARLVSDRLGGA